MDQEQPSTFFDEIEDQVEVIADWPKTEKELISSGYPPDNWRKCKRCESGFFGAAPRMGGISRWKRLVFTKETNVTVATSNSVQKAEPEGRIRKRKKRAVLQGDWKTPRSKEIFELYNLAKDPAENKDLASKNPAKARKLFQLHAAWLKEMVRSEKADLLSESLKIISSDVPMALQDPDYINAFWSPPW